MNEYRGKHSSSELPWAVAATAHSHYRSRHGARNRRRRIWRFLILAAVLAMLIWPFASARMLSVDRARIQSEDLPADIGHLRIVYVSDVHYGFFYTDGQMASLVNTINGLRPDLVLFGGDMGDSPEAAISFYSKLPSVHARYAMLGVLGDRDHGGDNLQRDKVTEAMRSAGVIPLVNALSPVRVGTSVIYVAGLDDTQAGAPNLEALSAAAGASDYVIFLSHNPSVIPDAQRATDRAGRLGWFDLALFGHTHGGQILNLGPLMGIGEDVEDRYRGGWLTENRSNLLISNGVGTETIPARLLRPAQIHCIDVSRP
ncbi:MAG: metallophosphoesterase [Clostridia bacterium]|nr:metallophosphoesterase [Clostridia bacterium]